MTYTFHVFTSVGQTLYLGPDMAHAYATWTDAVAAGAVGVSLEAMRKG